jgi:hypothetical protein
MADTTVSRRGELRYSGRRVAVSDLTAATRRVRCRNVRRLERALPETGYLFIDETYARSDTFSYMVLRRTPMVPGSKPATLFTGRRTASARRLRRYVNFKMTRNGRLNSLFSRRSDTVLVSIGRAVSARYRIWSDRASDEKFLP